MFDFTTWKSSTAEAKHEEYKKVRKKRSELITCRSVLREYFVFLVVNTVGKDGTVPRFNRITHNERKESTQGSDAWR